MERLALIAISVLSLAAPPAFGQAVMVSADVTSPDNVGKQLAAAVRQHIASSRLMTYTSSDQISSLRLKLVTLDPDSTTSQSQTVYSEVLVYHERDDKPEFYLSSSVVNCGSNKVQDCATSIFADLDEAAEAIRKSAVQK